MNKSESIKNIGAALAVFNGHVEKIKKDSTNPFFKSTYASLSNIQDSIAEALKISGIVYCQFPSGVNGLSTILIHPDSGEWMEDTYTMPVAKQNDPQAVGSAITYAKRYALCGALGLNVDDDDDGNAAAKQPAKPAAIPLPKTDTPLPFQDVMKLVREAKTKEALKAVWEKHYASDNAAKELYNEVVKRGTEL